ncbi:uncharacterized protein LOC133302094 [Gastrolobium bilobum]|uniref:uncharacterized protein LOC133302094 n=1 Tax=Gastrolobium bilobum TaxID=150636 RepID=UPI002AB103CB|nr:uncharacterized protein LOC133302094 [Gastrolobium bilobum]
MARNEGYQNVILESDSSSAITMLTSGSAAVCEIHLVSRIRTCLKKDWIVRLHRTYKEGNMCSDWLTNFILDEGDLADQVAFQEPLGGIHFLYLADIVTVGRDRAVSYF